MKRLQHRCISGQHYFLCHHLHSSFRFLQQLVVQNNKGHSRCECQAPKSSPGRAQQPLSYKLHQVRAGSIISIPFFFFPSLQKKRTEGLHIWVTGGCELGQEVRLTQLQRRLLVQLGGMPSRALRDRCLRTKQHRQGSSQSPSTRTGPPQHCPPGLCQRATHLHWRRLKSRAW